MLFLPLGNATPDRGTARYFLGCQERVGTFISWEGKAVGLNYSLLSWKNKMVIQTPPPPLKHNLIVASNFYN